jgi:hypothetical protein
MGPVHYKALAILIGENSRRAPPIDTGWLNQETDTAVFDSYA